MAENDGKSSESLAAFDPLIQTEDIAFDPKELIACGGCGRMNPPNRLKCLYCARELEIEPENVAAIKPNLRKLEIWERGWNVIVREMGSQVDNGKIAQLLSMETADLASILDVGTPLPLLRVESENEAAILQRNLEQLGLKCVLMSDADLAADKLRNDPQGLKRSGFGKRGFGSVASTSNLNQFTKYSRLQWHLL